MLHVFVYEFYPMHAQQLVIIKWMDSCIPKEEEGHGKKGVSPLYACETRSTRTKREERARNLYSCTKWLRGWFQLLNQMIT